MIRRWGTVIIMIAVLAVCMWWYLDNKKVELASPGGEVVRRELPYEKYQFEQLAKRDGVKSTISYKDDKFYYKSEGRQISGQVNRPTGEAKGIVVMARGYVDKEIYQTGMGTKNAAKVFAQNGYLTYAPDFSGYGESDPEDENALGARLVKPVEIIDLLTSLETELPVYLWGHSNGGQIMLSVAEILGMRKIDGVNVRGMTLWAPVTKPFPYNILYYTDESDDQGKWLRREISKFETDYDVYKYSIDKYYEQINLPIQIHQGNNDEAVPKDWSDEAVTKWKELGKEVTYYEYPGADHNMKPNWNQVVARDLDFFAAL